MEDGSPGFPETVDDLGTNDKLNDAEMSDGTERKAAADAAAKEEAIKAAAEAAAREEELRQARLRAAMEENERDEERARVERERAATMVRGAFMTIGTLPAAKKLIVALGLVSEATLSELKWLETREIVPGTQSQRSCFFDVERSKVVARAADGRHAFFCFFGKHFYRSDQPKTADGRPPLRGLTGTGPRVVQAEP
jgi:hypothetical protein